jgi:hypothetical protein
MMPTEESFNDVLKQIEEREQKSRQRALIYTLVPIVVAIFALLFIGWRIQQYRIELEELQNNYDDIKVKVASLQNQLDNIILELDKTQNTLESTEMKLTQTKQDLAKAEDELLLEQENVSDLKTKAEEYQKQVIILQVQLEEVNRALEQAEDAFRELTSLDQYKYTEIVRASSYVTETYPQQNRILDKMIYELKNARWKFGGVSLEEGFDSPGFAAYVLENVGIISEPVDMASNRLGALLPITNEPIVGDLIKYELNYYMFYFIDEKGQPFVVGMTPFGVLALRDDFTAIERIYRVSDNLASCDLASPPCNYTIRSGDNYSSITFRFYGSYEYTPFVMNWNRDDYGYRARLDPGKEILIPKLATDLLPEYPKCGIGQFPCLYTVQEGETYQGIAELIYGNPSAESNITAANWFWDSDSKIIRTPPLEEGLVLVLPRLR